MNHGRRISRIYASTLESAALGESAFYLRKAKQYLLHAETACENGIAAHDISRSGAKINEIIASIGEALAEIEKTEKRIVLEEEDEQPTEEPS